MDHTRRRASRWSANDPRGGVLHAMYVAADLCRPSARTAPSAVIRGLAAAAAAAADGAAARF